MSEDTPTLDASNLMLIVTGSHLRAEMVDRPMAYDLRQRVQRWLKQHDEAINVDLHPVVCGDIWYLNHTELRRRPTISVGRPEVNAVSALFAQSLSENGEQGEQIVIQLDPEFTHLHTCIWGTSDALTRRGIELFDTEYLGRFMRAVLTQVEPETD